MSHFPLNVGILGGTFNPAHVGHLQISLDVMKFYKLDYIIWLVANQNPLKKTNDRNILERANTGLKIVSHPKIIISAIEYEFECYETYDSLSRISQILPRAKIYWIMGMDNLIHFYKWKHWKRIIEKYKIIIFDRPVKERLSPFNNLNKRLTSNIIIHRGVLYHQSSTEIRANEKGFRKVISSNA